MTTVWIAAGAMLLVAAALTCYRILAGPSSLDRLVATEQIEHRLQSTHARKPFGRQPRTPRIGSTRGCAEILRANTDNPSRNSANACASILTGIQHSSIQRSVAPTL